MHTLLNLPLRSRRDVLQARQRARQVAALLHFSPDEQACIAAGAFAVAMEALRRSASGELCLQIENHALHIFPQLASVRSNQPAILSFFAAQRSLCMIKTLPADAPPLADDDLAWIAVQLQECASQSLFEEVRNQNQEVLALLSALHRCRAELENLRTNTIAA